MNTKSPEQMKFYIATIPSPPQNILYNLFAKVQTTTPV